MGSYAFYSGLRRAASLPIDLKELQTELDGLKSPVGPQTKPLVQQLFQNGLPNVEKDLEDWQGNLQHLDLGPPDSPPKPVQANYEDKVISAMSAASPKFTSFNCPILAIFALDGSKTQVVQAQALERSTRPLESLGSPMRATTSTEPTKLRCRDAQAVGHIESGG